ncbi:PqqD family peptide modification chaperone [Inquilinus sp.]|uniref:PqqD family peptide modification chaperone n=1 Tax=Inquilinus sp. TaxID=1932117 RepID=UPI0031E44958
MFGAANTVFVLVGERQVLFSERRQEVYELNDAAAYIWCRLQDGATPDAAAEGLVGLGFSQDAAGCHVRNMLDEWRRLGLFDRMDTDGAWPGADDDRIQNLRIAGLNICLRYGRSSLRRLVAPTFAHLEAVAAGPADVSLALEVDGDRIRLVGVEGDTASWDTVCTADEIVPAVKALLTAELLARGRHPLAIHAAALARDGRMLLLCGTPGVGKTTLAMALVQAGFGYGGDDIALLTEDGEVAGVPFAAAIKSGAWAMVSRCRPDLMGLPAFRRPDGQDVRYLPPDHLPVSTALPIGWVVVLRRGRSAFPVLTPLDRVAAIRLILAEASAPQGRLSTAAFRLLARSLGNAECHALDFSDLDGAVQTLLRTCR